MPAKNDEICPHCGQNHWRVFQCLRAKGGRAKKDPEQQRKKALKRWAAYRAAKAREQAPDHPPPPAVQDKPIQF